MNSNSRQTQNRRWQPSLAPASEYCNLATHRLLFACASPRQFLSPTGDNTGQLNPRMVSTPACIATRHCQSRYEVLIWRSLVWLDLWLLSTVMDMELQTRGWDIRDQEKCEICIKMDHRHDACRRVMERQKQSHCHSFHGIPQFSLAEGPWCLAVPCGGQGWRC